MPRMPGRERAFNNLMGRPFELGNPQSFAPSLTLPISIHRRLVDRVSATGQDTRERSQNFNYLAGRWLADYVFKGCALDVSDSGETVAETSTGSLLRKLAFPSHVYMHTHPRPDIKFANKFVSRVYYPNSRQSVVDVMEVIYPYPGEGDIVAWLIHAGGTTANIVSSEGGIFLAVRKNINDRSMTLFTPISKEEGELVEARKARAEKVKKEFSVARTAIARSSSDLGRSRQAELVSSFLASDYVSYFSEDLERRELERIN